MLQVDLVKTDFFFLAEKYFLKYFAKFMILKSFPTTSSIPETFPMYIEDLTRVVISYEIYETSLRRVS